MPNRIPILRIYPQNLWSSFADILILYNRWKWSNCATWLAIHLCRRNAGSSIRFRKEPIHVLSKHSNIKIMLHLAEKAHVSRHNFFHSQVISKKCRFFDCIYKVVCTTLLITDQFTSNTWWKWSFLAGKSHDPRHVMYTHLLNDEGHLHCKTEAVTSTSKQVRWTPTLSWKEFCKKASKIVIYLCCKTLSSA